MKKIYILSLLFSLLSYSLSAQEKSEFYKKKYKFYRYALLQKCNVNGVDVTGTETISIGFEFSIVELKDNQYIIRISKWNDESLNAQYVGDTQLTTGKKTDKIFFKLPITDFNEKCEEAVLRHTFTLGVVTLPIKMRFGYKAKDGSKIRDFTFSGDISLGLSAGYKYTRRGRYSHNFLTGIALSSVSVSPATTNGLITDETNLAAITWHLGYLFSVDNFQFGAFTGIDFLGGEVGRKWDYRNQPWLGIGIGYAIFQPKKTTDKQ